MARKVKKDEKDINEIYRLPAKSAAPLEHAHVKPVRQMRGSEVIRGFDVLPGERRWTEKQEVDGRIKTVKINVVSLTEHHVYGNDIPFLLEDESTNYEERNIYRGTKPYFISEKKRDR